MKLSSLQDKLVEHQKQKDELVERVEEIQNQVQSLTQEHQFVIQQGQLLEGGIALLNRLIEDERDGDEESGD